MALKKSLSFVLIIYFTHLSGSLSTKDETSHSYYKYLPEFYEELDENIRVRRDTSSSEDVFQKNSFTKESEAKKKLSATKIKESLSEKKSVIKLNQKGLSNDLQNVSLPEISTKAGENTDAVNKSGQLTVPFHHEDSSEEHSKEVTTETLPSDLEYDPDSGDDTMEPNTEYSITNAHVDHHRYYKSTWLSGMKQVTPYWVNLDAMPEEKVVSNEMLSSAHRRAQTVSLSFEFPFYGHKLRNITIATGGFLYTGTFLHTWLAATQYIAPLMANFDTSASDNATVKYADNGTSLTVLWDQVPLKDYKDAGTFTFQVTLHNSGNIVFVYKDVPIIVTEIKDNEHPVKVGLSDAYIIEKTIFYVRRKTIYEYHKIDMKKESQVANWTAIIFNPVASCPSFDDCESCVDPKSTFHCRWCARLHRCSDGLDRHRQDWLEKGCNLAFTSNISECASLPPQMATLQPSVSLNRSDLETVNEDAVFQASTKQDSKGSRAGAITTVVLIMLLIVVVVAWLGYAYYYPHSTSGQLLIKYRPAVWSWRRGDARYSAAPMHSVHM